jgi:hypothetical protein
VNDIATFMTTRVTADGAATLGWLEGEEFMVAKQSGGSSETFGNANVECQRKKFGMRVTNDRDQWKVDVAPPGFEFLNLEYLLSAKDGVTNASEMSEAATKLPAKVSSCHATLPGLITWIEEEERRNVLEGAKEAWRVLVRERRSTFNPSSR